VFQLFRPYVISVSSKCYKSRSDVSHVDWDPLAVATCCSCWGAAERTDGLYVQSDGTGAGGAGPTWAREMSRHRKRCAGKRASTRAHPDVRALASSYVEIVRLL
jgi:hypothetical protein